ncbi:MAG: capsid assembly protein [Metamycoplasmataceae bacterium]
MPYSHLTNSVMSDTDAEMAQLPVAVRDGDDLIEMNFDGADDEEEQNVELDVNTDEEHDEEESNDEDESSVEEDEGTDSEDDLPEYHKVDPKDLNEAAQMMHEAELGQQDLTAKAIEAGLAPEALETMKAEYEKGGKLSEKSYEALAKAGYSKTFVDSYMAGQEAVAERYVQAIMNHVGGAENFNKISKHIAATAPDVAVAFDAALERNDVATVRALLDSAASQMRQSPASKAPKRNIANSAKPAKPASTKAADKVSGFTNRNEMVKAMSDPRYGRDAEYRKEVELRVMYSEF